MKSRLCPRLQKVLLPSCVLLSDSRILNMVFTRINPNVRDTSVLVRLRPAWEDLREYLIAKGRKRYEFFVCTMAEREYALEFWRLLDPQNQLIKESDILQRVVCVKSASKKSLANVFVSGNCHPSMAMVIDDRLKVWENETSLMFMLCLHLHLTIIHRLRCTNFGKHPDASSMCCKKCSI